MSILLVLALLQDATKDDVLRLAREGAKEEALLAKIGRTVYKLTVDEIVELKKAGLPEKVLARMIEGPRDVKVTNLAHKPIGAAVRNGVLEITTSGGLAKGDSVQLPGGELRISVDGAPRAVTVKAPATLTFRGCDLDDFEVVTLYIEDAKGSETCMVEMRTKDRPRVVGVPRPVGARLVRDGLFERIADGLPRLIGALTDGLFGF